MQDSLQLINPGRFTLFAPEPRERERGGNEACTQSRFRVGTLQRQSQRPTTLLTTNNTSIIDRVQKPNRSTAGVEPRNFSRRNTAA
jgi:hypothetical protein